MVLVGMLFTSTKSRYCVCYGRWMCRVYNFIWNKICTFYASLQKLRFKYSQSTSDCSYIMQNVMALFLPPLGSPKYLCTRDLHQFRQRLFARGEIKPKESNFTSRLLYSVAFASDCSGSDASVEVRCKNVNGLSQNNWWRENAETRMSSTLM